MTRRIALTGATGFIGGNLVKRLAKAGWKIQALSRPDSDRSRLAGIPLQWIEGDLNNLDSLRYLVRNADAIVHCAGAVRGTSETQFDGVNVNGVAKLVQAASEQHLTPRFLLISSLAARQPQLSPYAASKRKGEEALARGAGAMFWAAFRPSAVYGPGDREMLPIFRWIARGIAPVLGSGEGRFSLLFVDDLIEAILLWLEQANRKASVFELHDGRSNGYSWQDVIDIAARLRGRGVLRAPVPTSIIKLVAAINLGAARIMNYSPMLTPGKVRELTHADWVCDNTALFEEIGWKPQVTLESGLPRTLASTTTRF